MMGAKVYSLVERGVAQELRWELANGYRYPGGLLAAVVVMLGVVAVPQSRRMGQSVLDASAIGTGCAMAVMRIGCFVEGCCYGRPTDLPWGLTFAPESHAWTAHVRQDLLRPDAMHSLPVHPLQLYFAFSSLAIVMILLRVERRVSYPGQLFLLFVLIDQSAKALLELLRDPVEPHLISSSALFASAAGGGLLWMFARARWNAMSGASAPVWNLPPGLPPRGTPWRERG
jgi:phosphatidylglycerol:prolipoprotein diacylglycerol transferase